MSLLTSWGYTLTDVDTLPVLITETDFNTMTGGRFTGDTRISSALSAASLALQNYCGWHLSGPLKCKIQWNIKNRGIIRNGMDLIVQLPARLVSSIESVKIDNEATTDYMLNPNGHLTIYDAVVSGRRTIVEVVYNAGVVSSSGVQELVAQMASLELSKSYGITSEAAGGVSITYNSSWTNGSFDRVIENNAGMLAGYRLEGVF